MPLALFTRGQYLGTLYINRCVFWFLFLLSQTALGFFIITPTHAEDFVHSGKTTKDEDFGYFVKGAEWHFKSAQKKVIHVCWENPNSDNAPARAWVRDQIEKTWQKNTQLKFRGWQKCAVRNSGIRILWSDEGPHVKKFGKWLNGVKNGMVLNHVFQKWGRSCTQKLKACVRSIAVHEFGHALGFAHEQNRPDTPGECFLKHGQNQKKELMLTPYDPESVMNYCNPRYNNLGKLSKLDIKSAQKIYGIPSSP